jgi:hypothetical protein
LAAPAAGKQTLARWMLNGKRKAPVGRRNEKPRRKAGAANIVDGKYAVRVPTGFQLPTI